MTRSAQGECRGDWLGLTREFDCQGCSSRTVISPHKCSGLGNGLFEQLMKLNLFVTFGRLCNSHNDLLTRLFWLGPVRCSLHRTGPLIWLVFFFGAGYFLAQNHMFVCRRMLERVGVVFQYGFASQRGRFLCQLTQSGNQKKYLVMDRVSACEGRFPAWFRRFAGVFIRARRSAL